MKYSVYLDNAATTPLDPRVLKVMLPFFNIYFGNPSALYETGQIANAALNDSRRRCAEILHTQPESINFTSGGTESDNLAILGIARAHAEQGRHIITTPIEHQAVLQPLAALKKQGWEITYLPIDRGGVISASEVIKAIRPTTTLISISYANNEIGTIEPVAEIGRQLMRYRKKHFTPFPYFHTDACQASGSLDLNVEKLHVDLLTLNGGKMYGPKGTGLLYVRRGVVLEPLIYGGSQEHGLRPGTENLPGIVGFATALHISQQEKDQQTARFSKLAIYFWKQLQQKFPGVKLNGPMIGESRLPNNLNIYFPGVEGEALLLYLSEQAIMCSTGSACTAQSNDTSYVLKAIGLDEIQSRASIRFSLGMNTSRKDVDFVVTALKKIMPLVVQK